MDKDYYRILQIDPSADAKAIKAAYKKLAKEYHPDINTSSDATGRMQDINEAYEVLRNPSKRAWYNRMRSVSNAAPPSAPARPRPTADEDRRRRQQQAEAARQRAEQYAAEERTRVERLRNVQRFASLLISVGLATTALVGILIFWLQSDSMAALPSEATPTTDATAYPPLILNPTSFPRSVDEPDVTQQLDIEAISMVASKNLLAILVDSAINLYSRGDGGWEFQQQIPFPPSYRDQRRTSMALDDQTLVVAFSLSNNDYEGRYNNVYIFSQEPDGTWVQTQTLENQNHRSALGAAVLIEDGFLYVGTIGASDNLTVYQKHDNQWVVKQIIEAEGRHYNYGGGFAQGSGQFFDVNGSILAIGQDRYGESYGKVIIYQKSPDGNWAPKQAVGPFGDTIGFGLHTRVEGSTLVASILDDQFVVFNDLSEDATWSYFEPTVLGPANDNQSEDRFISDVSFNEDYVVFATGVQGSRGADDIFVFRRTEGKWDIAFVINKEAALIVKTQLVEKTLFVLMKSKLLIFDLP